jgi:hypothetical protein
MPLLAESARAVLQALLEWSRVRRRGGGAAAARRSHAAACAAELARVYAAVAEAKVRIFHVGPKRGAGAP